MPSQTEQSVPHAPACDPAQATRSGGAVQSYWARREVVVRTGRYVVGRGCLLGRPTHGWEH